MHDITYCLAQAARWVGACAAASLLLACSSTANHPPAPVSASTHDYNYIVGPGDNINIIVWRNPELSMAVPVRPDGKISTPLIDELVAQGKTSVQIAREVEAKLSTYVRDPVVTVIITGFVGPYDQQIRVVGEAARPPSLPFKQYMTLLDLIIAVGGLPNFADGNQATILHRRRRQGRRRRQAVFGPAARPDQAWRHLRERGNEARRHSHHPAGVLLKISREACGRPRRPDTDWKPAPWKS